MNLNLGAPPTFQCILVWLHTRHALRRQKHRVSEVGICSVHTGPILNDYNQYCWHTRAAAKSYNNGWVGA